MTDAINTNRGISEIMSNINLGPNDSVQMRFAALQMAQSMLCKSAAEDYMNQIESIQAEQKKCSEMIAKARELKQMADNNTYEGKGVTGKTVAENCAPMPQEMIDFMESNNLPFPNDDGDYILGGKNANTEEWDFTIQSLTNYQESISNKTQTLMVYLQDYIGQYNSFTQGASAQVSQAMQVLTAVATGR